MDTETAETQETMTPAVPQREHEWLHRMLGEWTYEMDAPEGKEAEKSTGTETVRSLGGLWVLLEGKGRMPGGEEASTLMTLGYDPGRGAFVGSWIGSMMTWFWVYEGRLDGQVLSLESEGPDMKTPGKTRRYKDVIELVSDDHRTLTGNVLGEDGSWQPMMTVHYRRKT